MRPIFFDSFCKSYKTERFCSAADQNVTLFVETFADGDGSETRICENVDSCKNKSKCRYDETN